MPEKTTAERAKRAKSKGTTLAVKASDIGTTTARSTHAAKKSKQVVGFVPFEDRHVSKRSPPGQGKTAAGKTSGRKTVQRADQLAFKKSVETLWGDRMPDDSGEGRRRAPPTRVNGRKKAPSQMNVRRKGGPFKKSRLHGG